MHTDAAVRSAILGILARRAPGASVCPSEVARAIAPQSWRAVMEAVRQAAWGLAAERRVEVTQRGRVVGPGARGPIRLRLCGSGDDAGR